MHPHRMSAGLTLLVLVAACAGPERPPAGAKITCDEANPCPAPLTCRVTIGRCLAPGEGDGPPPSVVAGSAHLTPAIAGPQRPITLEFDVDGALARDPEVVLATAPPRAFSAVSHDGAHHVYALTPAGTEPEGPYAVLVTLVDAYGHVAKDVAVATVTLDPTAPRAMSLEGPDHAVNGPVTLELRTSEAAAEVRLTDGTGAELARGPDGADPLVTTWTWTPPAGATSGPVDVTVELADVAGNRSTRRFSQVFTVDTEPPGIAADFTRLRLVPGPDNLLRTVTAVRAGTEVLVTFTATERLQAAPAVHGTGPGTLEFSLVADDDPVFTYALDFTAGEEGTYTIEVAMKDVAGNAATASAGTFVVDTTPPPAPDVMRPEGLVHRREPWGSEAHGAGRRFSLSVDPAAIPGTSVVIARDRADAATAAELGRAAVQATPFEVPLTPADRTSVFAVAVDAAGNESAAAEVRDVAWVANLRGKMAGSRFENPTSLVATPTAGATRSPEATTVHEATSTELAAASMADGNAAMAAADHGWLDRTPSDASPLALTQRLPVAYDAARGKVVLFTENQLAHAAETWEWDTVAGRWTKRVVAGESPPARSNHLLTYDAARGRVVLMGGCASAGAGTLDDVWEWDGDEGRWIDRTPSPRPAGWPGARLDASATFDGITGRILVFGGDVNCSARSAYGTDRMAAWDGRAGTFTDLTPATRSISNWPPARTKAAFGFDPERGKAVLFGARMYGDDLWEWDPRTSTWTAAFPFARPPSWPGQRGYATFAWVPSLHALALFGGWIVVGEQKYDDLWTWDGTAFTERAKTSPWPSGEDVDSLVWDARAGRLVMIGGNYQPPSSIGIARPRIWDWSPELGWASRNPSGLHPFAGDGLVYDPNRRKFLMLGSDLDHYTYHRQIWELDPRSAQWTLRSDPQGSGTAPTARSRAAIAFDAARRRLVHFGGRVTYQSLSNELWEWNPDDATWTQRTPTGPRPDARTATSAVWSAACGCTLFYGGSALDGSARNELWEWHGDTGTFVQRTSATFPPMLRASGASGADLAALSAFDAAHDRWYLAGGDANGSVWTWDVATSAWTTLAPGGPAALNPQAFVFDPARGRPWLLWGAWELDAANVWQSRPVRGPRPTIPYLATDVAADPARGKVFVAAADQTWEWSGGAEAAPAWQWTVPLEALGETPGTVLGLDVEAAAGADGGAALEVWDSVSQGWKGLATNLSTGALAWHGADAREIGALATGVPPAFVFQVRGRAPSGTSPAPAKVALDGIELTLRYRR